MNQSDITVIIPTYNRVDVLRQTLATIPHPPELTMLVVKRGRQELDIPTECKHYRVIHTDPAGAYVGAIQDAITMVDTKLFLVGNDDAHMEPDTIWRAAAGYYHLFGDADGVLGLNHGKAWAHLACMALMSKAWFMRECYPMPYHHYCADNEWTQKAVAMGCYGRCLRANVQHHFGAHVEPWHTNDWELFTPRMNLWYGKRQVLQAKG